MKKLSKKYKEWSNYRARKIQRKQKKYVYSSFRRADVNINGNNEKHTAPNIFSFIKNPNETIEFFSYVLRSIKLSRHSKKSIFINIRDIKDVTIDAIMYLLTIINNLRMSYKYRIDFSGNMPEDAKLRKLITDSGFYDYVKKENDDPININENNFQIVASDFCDVELIKRIVDFVDRKNASKKKIDSLYSMLVELTSNTQEHAYMKNDKNGLFEYRWYCYANCVDDDYIAFSFVDNGKGIPATVKKYLSDVMGNDNKYLISALDGSCKRTRTGKSNRGLGLPKIRSLRKGDYIQNLHIITNKADVIVNIDSYSENIINYGFNGTLFYWEIYI